MGDQNITTVKTKAADAITDIKAARNLLAVAIRNYNRSQSRADREKIETARKNVERLELVYKEGRDAQLIAVADRMKRK